MFVDIAKHGHGESVSRLDHGIGEKQIEERVQKGLPHPRKEFSILHPELGNKNKKKPRPAVPGIGLYTNLHGAK